VYNLVFYSYTIIIPIRRRSVTEESGSWLVAGDREFERYI
jgi:hypothetical protein